MASINNMAPIDLLGCQTMDSTSEIELILQIKNDVIGKLGFFAAFGLLLVGYDKH
jgi:hypothetical protein